MIKLGGRYETPWLFAWVKERRYAKRASVDLLDAYRVMLAEGPELSGKVLYEHVVQRHMGVDRTSALGVILRAEQSFAKWPVDRALTFRDVVAYLVVSEYLKLGVDRRGVDRRGTQSNMRAVVNSVIPENL